MTVIIVFFCGVLAGACALAVLLALIHGTTNVVERMSHD